MPATVSLRDSVRNVVRTCARVQPGDLVCVAGDAQTMPIALAMKAADVVIQPVTFAMTHTDATQEALRAGAWVLVLRGITEDIMTHGAMLADYDEVDRVSREVARLMSEARTGRRARNLCRDAGRRGGHRAGRGDRRRRTGGRPYDGQPRVARCADPETVRGGRVAEIAGGASAGKLQTLVAAADANARNIAEFAIGTNDRARLIGSMTEDKKLRGSVHIAIGDNHVIGGTVVSELHLDGLLLRPTVELDGKIIVQDGRLLVGG